MGSMNTYETLQPPNERRHSFCLFTVYCFSFVCVWYTFLVLFYCYGFYIFILLCCISFDLFTFHFVSVISLSILFSVVASYVCTFDYYLLEQKKEYIFLAIYLIQALCKLYNIDIIQQPISSYTVLDSKTWQYCYPVAIYGKVQALSVVVQYHICSN